MYLHCDSTASHYLKSMMDAIFGRKNFRNEIIWKRTNSRSDGNQFGRVHDILLFYSKGKGYTWNNQYFPHDPDYIKRVYNREDERGKFSVVGLTAPDPSKGESGKPWRGINPTALGRHWSTPIKGGMNDYIVKNGIIPGWPEKYTSVHAPAGCARCGRVDLLAQEAGGGVPRLKAYLDASKGPKVNDIWDDIKRLEANSKEKTGWPTQKPLALYGRMVAASSAPDDMVLDPFAGCATTCVAAEQLGRRWIAVDLDTEAEGTIFERLKNEVNANMAWNDIVRVFKVAPGRTDDGEPAAPDLVLKSPKQKEKRISVPEARKQLELRDGMRCRGCGWVPPRLEYLHVDHKKPKKLEGANTLKNLVLLCEPCNRLKSYKMSLAQLRDRRQEQGEGYINMDWYEREGKWE